MDPPLDLREWPDRDSGLEALLEELASTEEPAPSPVSEVNKPVAVVSVIDSRMSPVSRSSSVGTSGGKDNPRAVHVPTVASEPGCVLARCSVDQFPLCGLVDGLSADEDALGMLKSLCGQIRAGIDYRKIRLEICIQSIRLNLAGTIAPAFRPAVKGAGDFNDPIHRLIHRDRQVVDLHWCYSRRMEFSPTEIQYTALFEDCESFDFQSAWELSGKKWSKDFRATEALCLTPFQQCQLVVLRSEELVKREKALDEGRRGRGGAGHSKRSIAKRVIAEWAESNRRIAPHRRDYELLWLARELLASAATMKSIAQLHALMCGGDPLDPKTVSDKMKKLDRCLAGLS
ncbi:hypothetical protein G7047_28280 [Diaphorobacter sp. HDW4A]|uniref:hypothetical protein n=1 Tax=Diaphorobacter sp. HDW4A TaxID=2714924 RepID=UPI00140B787A|nr:hypothetical protein [Diaphorobacter sp. HDW4A]QIL83410.1 hypothetical protein G7047_28280 [Diaphorobacter sp. HDW4A]